MMVNDIVAIFEVNRRHDILKVDEQIVTHLKIIGQRRK